MCTLMCASAHTSVCTISSMRTRMEARAHKSTSARACLHARLRARARARTCSTLPAIHVVYTQCLYTHDILRQPCMSHNVYAHTIFFASHAGLLHTCLHAYVRTCIHACLHMSTRMSNTHDVLRDPCLPRGSIKLMMLEELDDLSVPAYRHVHRHVYRHVHGHVCRPVYKHVQRHVILEGT